MPKTLTMSELIEELATLNVDEQLELCDALVDRAQLRELLERIDDYLYLDKDDDPPLNLIARDRLLN